MARQPEFDRDRVVTAAMHVFWLHGYQGTSMRALVEATGLKPGSLYAAFGSKGGLYRAALRTYVARVKQVVLDPDLDAYRRIERWLRTHIRSAVEGAGRGCLLLHSASELPRLDEESALLVRRAVEAQRATFESWIVEARQSELRPDLPPPDASARLLLAAFAGISTLGRAGATLAELNAIGDATLAAVA